MGLSDRNNRAIFVKESTSAELQVFKLETLLVTASNEIKPKIEQELRAVKAGIMGEEKVIFELKNSHIPMYVLHDLYLEDNGISAQIDFLIITEKINFVIECKNLYGNIEINSKGEFIRTVKYGDKYVKEGMYSPITQNRRHIELIKQIRGKTKTNFFTKAMFENNFSTMYSGIIVLSNHKTLLNTRYVKTEVKNQVIRVDQLIAYIQTTNKKSRIEACGNKHMEDLAQFFLSAHKERSIDYLAKYRSDESDSLDKNNQKNNRVNAVENTIPIPDKEQCESATQTILCVKCGAAMIQRVATKGERAGKKFLGCSNFPKCRCIINIKE